MNILVTGATGFVGRHLVKKLVDLEYRVFISLLPEEDSPFCTEIKTHVFQYMNIKEDIQYLKDNYIIGVIHLASLYISAHQSDQATQLIDSNVKFGTHILESSVKANVKWFINTGTFWQHFNNADYSPVNLYAASKQAFDSIAQYYIETNQIKFCTIKLSDTFGPNDSRPKIFNLWQKIAMTGELFEMSPGDQLIDISYIDDIVDAFYLLVVQLQTDNLPFINGSCFAVNADERITLKDLALTFERVTGYRLNIKWGAKPYKDREVMSPWSKGKRVPKWEPKFGIYDGLKKILKQNS